MNHIKLLEAGFAQLSRETLSTLVTSSMTFILRTATKMDIITYLCNQMKTKEKCITHLKNLGGDHLEIIKFLSNYEIHVNDFEVIKKFHNTFKRSGKAYKINEYYKYIIINDFNYCLNDELRDGFNHYFGDKNSVKKIKTLTIFEKKITTQYSFSHDSKIIDFIENVYDYLADNDYRKLTFEESSKAFQPIKLSPENDVLNAKITFSLVELIQQNLSIFATPGSYFSYMDFSKLNNFRAQIFSYFYDASAIKNFGHITYYTSFETLLSELNLSLKNSKNNYLNIENFVVSFQKKNYYKCISEALFNKYEFDFTEDQYLEMDVLFIKFFCGIMSIFGFMEIFIGKSQDRKVKFSHFDNIEYIKPTKLFLSECSNINKQLKKRDKNFSLNSENFEVKISFLYYDLFKILSESFEKINNNTYKLISDKIEKHPLSTYESIDQLFDLIDNHRDIPKNWHDLQDHLYGVVNPFERHEDYIVYTLNNKDPKIMKILTKNEKISKLIIRMENLSFAVKKRNEKRLFKYLEEFGIQNEI